MNKCHIFKNLKGVPIEDLGIVQKIVRDNIRGGLYPTISRIRYIFRGPRVGKGATFTMKCHAHSFDVYYQEKE